MAPNSGNTVQVHHFSAHSGNLPPGDSQYNAALRTQHLAYAKAGVDREVKHAVRNPGAHAKQEDVDKAKLDLAKKQLARSKRRRQFVDTVAFLIGVFLAGVIAMVAWSIADQESYLKFVCGLNLSIFDCSDATSPPDETSPPGNQPPGNQPPGSKPDSKCRPTNDQKALRMTQQVGSLAALVVLMGLGVLVANIHFGERLRSSYLKFVVPLVLFAVACAVWLALNNTLWVLCPGGKLEDVPAAEDQVAGVATLLIAMGLIWFWRFFQRGGVELVKVTGDFPDSVKKTLDKNRSKIQGFLPDGLKRDPDTGERIKKYESAVPTREVQLHEIKNPVARKMAKAISETIVEFNPTQDVDSLEERFANFMANFKFTKKTGRPAPPSRPAPKLNKKKVKLGEGAANVLGGDIERYAREMEKVPEDLQDPSHAIVQAMVRHNAAVQGDTVRHGIHTTSLALLRRTVSDDVIREGDPRQVGELVADLNAFVPVTRTRNDRKKMKRASSVEELEDMVNRERDRLAARLGFVGADGGYLFHGIDRDSDIAIEDQFRAIAERILDNTRNVHVEMRILTRENRDLQRGIEDVSQLFRVGITQANKEALTQADDLAKEIGDQLVTAARKEAVGSERRMTWIRLANSLAAIRANVKMAEALACQWAKWKEERFHSPQAHAVGLALYGDARNVFATDFDGGSERAITDAMEGMSSMAEHWGLAKTRGRTAEEALLESRPGRMYKRIANAMESTVIPSSVSGPIERRVARATVSSIGVFQALSIFFLATVAIANFSAASTRTHPWMGNSVIINVQGVQTPLDPHILNMQNLVLSASANNLEDSIGYLEKVYRNPEYAYTLTTALTSTGLRQGALRAGSLLDDTLQVVPSNINFEAVEATENGVAVAQAANQVFRNLPSREVKGLQSTLDGAYWAGAEVAGGTLRSGTVRNAVQVADQLEATAGGAKAVQDIKAISGNVLDKLKKGMSVSAAADFVCQYAIVDNANSIVKAFGAESQGDSELALKAVCKTGIAALGTHNLMLALAASNPGTALVQGIFVGLEAYNAGNVAEGVLVRGMQATGLAEKIGYVTRTVDQNNIRNAILDIVEHHPAALETIDVDSLVKQAMDKMINVERITGQKVDSEKFAQAMVNGINNTKLTEEGNGFFSKAYRQDLDEIQVEAAEDAGNLEKRGRIFDTKFADDTIKNEQFVRYKLPGGNYGLIPKEQAKALLIGPTIEGMGNIMEADARQVVADNSRFAPLRPALDSLFGKIRSGAEINRDDFGSMKSTVQMAVNNHNAKFEALENRLRGQGPNTVLYTSEMAEIRRKMDQFPGKIADIERKYYDGGRYDDAAIKRESADVLEEMQKVIEEGEVHYNNAREQLSFLNTAGYKLTSAAEMVSEGVSGLASQAGRGVSNIWETAKSTVGQTDRQLHMAETYEKWKELKKAKLFDEYMEKFKDYDPERRELEARVRVNQDVGTGEYKFMGLGNSWWKEFVKEYEEKEKTWRRI